MFKIAVLVWIVLSVTLAGSFVTVVVAVPSLAGDAMRLVPVAAAMGAVLAIPGAWIIARRVYGITGR